MWRRDHLHLLFSFGIFLGLMFLVACQNKVDGEEGNQTPVTMDNPTQIVFTQDSLIKQSSHCAIDSNKCAQFSLFYPYAKSGPTDLCVAFNRLQLKFLKNSLQQGESEAASPSTNLEALADAFLADYDELLADASPYEMPWELETTGAILFQNEKIVSVRLQQYNYTGGAHPNSYTTLWMLDKQTGEALDFKYMGTNTDSLLVIAEEAFRSVIDLPREKRLEEAGFFLGETFFLPQNYAWVKEGLLLYYNTYEIAPYAVGPTEVIIPLARLEGIFEKNNWY